MIFQIDPLPTFSRAFVAGIEIEREADDRWIADVIDLPGVMAYGRTPDEAISRAKVLAAEVLSGAADETAALRRVVENQNRALAHWRRKSDEDAGRLARYSDALRRIGHDPGETKSAAELRAIARETLAGEVLL